MRERREDLEHRTGGEAQIWRYTSVDSTMKAVREIEPTLDDQQGLIIFADKQTAGRGRQGKVWFHGEGGLAVTILLPKVTMTDLSGFSLAVGLCLVEALSLGSVGVQLKWPNDLLTSDGKKLAGILIETGERVSIGIGLNIREAPIGGTSLHALGVGSHLCRESVLERFIPELLAMTKLFASTGFSAFQPFYAGYDFLFNKAISVVEGDRVLHHGIGAGVDGDGALRVKEGATIARVVSGSVLLSDEPTG